MEFDDLRKLEIALAQRDEAMAELHALRMSIQKSAPPPNGSLPSGESGPPVMAAAGGADTIADTSQLGNTK